MRRLWSLLLLLPVSGLAVVAIGPASPATHPSVPASKQVRAAAAARAFLAHLQIGRPLPDQRVPGPVTHTQGLSQFKSFNWSGYADDNTAGNTYSKVTGKWTEPAITCPTKEDQIAVFWVGIDGFSSGTVEQDGTLAQCFLGTAFYDSWWEMFPGNNIQVVGTSVAPGDSITSSVSKSGTTYTLKLTDATHTANSFSTAQTCAATTCAASSAEWIAEAPGGPRGEYPLPDFTAWSLKGATVKSGATSGVITTFPDDVLTMIDGTQTYALAKPGALNSTGNGFKVAWKNSY